MLSYVQNYTAWNTICNNIFIRYTYFGHFVIWNTSGFPRDLIVCNTQIIPDVLKIIHYLSSWKLIKRYKMWKCLIGKKFLTSYEICPRQKITYLSGSKLTLSHFLYMQMNDSKTKVLRPVLVLFKTSYAGSVKM